MFDINSLPGNIFRKVKNRPMKIDKIGESGSTVVIFDNMVLKVERHSEPDNEYIMLQWLEGRLPVPKVICYEISGGYRYLLMSKLSGEMTLSDKNMASPERTVRVLADGLKRLWSVDISGCPIRLALDGRLDRAKYNLDNNIVDLDDLKEDTLGEKGFPDLRALYDFLCRNKPEEDMVFSHGDYCLPNIFMEWGELSGFVDLGGAGIADRYQDIALCVRSLGYNYAISCDHSDGSFETYRNMLFNELGIIPNEEKIRYYILLDEFF